MRLVITVTVCAMISLLAYMERGCFAIGGEMFVQFAWMIFMKKIKSY